MRPHLIIGNDKAIWDYASSVAKENSYHFVPLEAKEFRLFEKQFYTSSLDQALSLFYLRDANSLTVDEAQQFVEMVKDSPHKFLLASSEMVNWYLRRACIFRQLQPIQDELMSQLKILLTEKDRRLALQLLKGADPVHLFHLLKYGAWQNPETLEAMILISQNVYKVRKQYLLAMLAVAIPPKPFAFGHKKRVENEMQKSVKKKIHDEMRSLRKAEVADIFLLMKSTKDSFGVQLSEEEEKRLGIADKQTVQPQAVFVKCANLEDYF